MAITTNLKKSDGVDLGNNLFAGNGTNSGNQTFNIIQSNGVDLGRGWYNKSSCYAVWGNVGFKNSAGTDVGQLLGKYGTLNCDCDVDVCDTDNDNDTDSDTDGCFVYGHLLTMRGLVDVSKVQVGDFLWGADEKWHAVVGVAKNKVGARGIFTVDGGGVVTADHVVFMGACEYVPSMDAWQKTVGNMLVASNGVMGMYASGSPVEIDGASLYTANPETPTYSPICETKCIGYLNGARVLIAGQV